MSKVITICGGMFSGKSTELIKRGERFARAKKRVLFIKPSLDTRYSDTEVVTHTGIKVHSKSVKDPTEIIPLSQNYDVICIDEIQFFDTNLPIVIDQLARADKIVVCAGLDLNFKGYSFRNTIEIMGMANEVMKLHAICDVCGDDAWVSAKRGDAFKIVELGSSEMYTPMCRLCYFSSI